MATRYPTQAVKALGARGNAMARAFGAKVPARRPAPKAPKRSAGPRLGGDTIQDYAPPPSAGAIDYGNMPTFSGGYGVGSDPAVARIAALAGNMRAQAQASADAKRKQAVLEYGDATGVEGIDAATAQQAKENPFSIIASQKRAYDTGVSDLNEGLNKANLFYSGYRGQQLGEAATAYQQQGYDAGNRFRATITDINDALAAALMQADMMDAEAMGGSDGGYYDPGWYDEGYERDPFLDQWNPDVLAGWATPVPVGKMPKPRQVTRAASNMLKAIAAPPKPKAPARSIQPQTKRPAARPAPKPAPKKAAPKKKGK